MMTRQTSLTFLPAEPIPAFGPTSPEAPIMMLRFSAPPCIHAPGTHRKMMPERQFKFQVGRKRGIVEQIGLDSRQRQAIPMLRQ